MDKKGLPKAYADMLDKFSIERAERGELLDNPELDSQIEARHITDQLAERAGRMLAFRLGEKYGIDRVTLETILPPGYDPKSMRQKSKEFYVEQGFEVQEEDLPYSDLSLDEVLTDVAERLGVEFGAIQISRKAGDTHISSTDLMPERFIRYLAVEMLETCRLHELKTGPVVLGWLLRDLLEIRHFGLSEYREPHRWKVAILLKAKSPTATAYKIANQLDVERSTVTRWFKSPEFMDAVEKLRSDSDEIASWERALSDGYDLPDIKPLPE
jgi:hypothetical protein